MLSKPFMSLTGALRLLVAAAVATATLFAPFASPANADVPDRPPILIEGINDGTEGTLRASTYLGSRLYVGGAFQNAGGQSHPNVAAVNMNTRQIDHNWDVRTNGMVHAMIAAPDGSGIYIGGDFTAVNGTGRQFIAKLDPVSGALLPEQIDVNNSVYAFATHGDRLYIGGRFSQVDGTNHRRLVAMRNDQVLGNWFANASVSVRDIKLTSDGATMFVAGSFDSLDGSPAPQRVGKIRAADGVRLTWDVQVNNAFTVIDLAISGDDQTVFMATGGPPGDGGNRTKAVRASDGAFLWEFETRGDPQAVLETEGAVYVGGHFIPGNISRNRLLAANAANGVVLPWSPRVNSTFGVWDLDPSPWGMVVVGDFTFIDGVSRRHIAIYDQVNFPNLPGPAEPTCEATLVNGEARLTWDPVPGENSYAMRRDGRWIANAPGPTFTDTAAAPGPHSYVVRANVGGTVTNLDCGSVTVPTGGAPCTLNLNGNGDLDMQWDPVPGENRYAVRRDGRWIASVNALTYTDTTATPGSHSYMIRARVGGVVTNLDCGSITIP